MQPEQRDMARLWDMLDAAKAIIEFTQGRRYEGFITDRMLRNAVERNLEILGEAARRVSQATQEKAPGIPWKSLVGLRNVLAHEYGEIRYERLWAICTTGLEELIGQLVAMGVDISPSEEE